MKKLQPTMIRLKARVALGGLWWLMKKPLYLILAFIIAFMFFELTYWLFNLEVLRILLSSPLLSIVEKFEVLVSPIEAIATASGRTIIGMMLFLALLQGISIAALVYILRHQRKVDSKLLGGSYFVSLIAIVGLGCPACGTSIVTPLIAIFASSSAVAISETVTTIALPFALLISVYGLYSVGQRVASVRAEQDLHAKH
jgi:hypothetical protein